jgi:uncharacterized protein (TIGR02145 family)
MAENLNYVTDSSWCYDNEDSNCATYGRLYTWNAAMEACPAGWHLPTLAEWNTLPSGTKLKATSPAWDGTDDLGFSALPGGTRNTEGSFEALSLNGIWWTATEADSSFAWRKNMVDVITYLVSSNKGNGFSVRCLMD